MRYKWLQSIVLTMFVTCFISTIAPCLLVDLQIDSFIDNVCDGRFDKVNTCKGMCVIQKANNVEESPLSKLVIEYPKILLNEIPVIFFHSNANSNYLRYPKKELLFYQEVPSPPPRYPLS